MQGGELKGIRRELGFSQAEMAEALSLTATFVGLMERGEKPVDPRTALAARQLFNEQSRLYGGHNAQPLEGDVPLADAMILWDRDDGLNPRVVVIGHPEKSDSSYSSSYGSCNLDWSTADDVGRLLRLFSRFIELTVAEGLTPREVHEAFSVIPEYRRAMALGMFKVGVGFD